MHDKLTPRIYKKEIIKQTRADGTEYFTATVVMEKRKLFGFIPIRKRYWVHALGWFPKYDYHLLGYQSTHYLFNKYETAMVVLDQCIGEWRQQYLYSKVVKHVTVLSTK